MQPWAGLRGGEGLRTWGFRGVSLCGSVCDIPQPVPSSGTRFGLPSFTRNPPPSPIQCRNRHQKPIDPTWWNRRAAAAAMQVPLGPRKVLVGVLGCFVVRCPHQPHHPAGRLMPSFVAKALGVAASRQPTRHCREPKEPDCHHATGFLSVIWNLGLPFLSLTIASSDRGKPHLGGHQRRGHGGFRGSATCRWANRMRHRSCGRAGLSKLSRAARASGALQPVTTCSHTSNLLAS